MSKETNGIRPLAPLSAESTPAEYTGKTGSPIHEFIAMTLWLGTLHFIAFIVVASFLLLPRYKFFMVLGMLVVLIFIPVNDNNKWGLFLARYIFKNVAGYFPVTVYVEDIKAFNPNLAYGFEYQLYILNKILVATVFGYEPHSVWPLGAGILSDLARYIPITKIKILASSAVFYVPLLRHYWTWMGVSSVNKKNFLSLLKAGYSCIVVPGGVQETFYMKHDSEVAFVKARKGFIRLAMETDSPVVPVFAFGQSFAYKWWKPRGKFFLKLSRAMKFTPMVYWGTFWSFIPFRRPIYMVVGKPIHFKKNSTPSIEEVSEVLDQYVEALQTLFEKHKTRAGYPDLELQIIFPRLFALEEDKEVSVASKLGSSSVDSSFRRLIRDGIERQQWSDLSSLLESVILSPSKDRWLESVILSPSKDRWFCDLNGEGAFRVKDARSIIDDIFLPSSEVATRWVKYIPIKINIFMWRARLDRISTRCNLASRGVVLESSLCPLCGLAPEDAYPI
ncbi:diacylglycerol O-acyltransferase 2D-like protein [Tanacetum coccineum]